MSDKGSGDVASLGVSSHGGNVLDAFGKESLKSAARDLTALNLDHRH